MTGNERCDLCYWWRKSPNCPKDGDYGSCHYNAPIGGSAFGKTDAEDFCKEWMDKDDYPD